MKAAILINVGSPASPSVPDVRAYLEEFLMDRHVVDLAYPLRWFLVHAIILPRRPAASAELYRSIWTERGSPLRVHLTDLVAGVQGSLGTEWRVLPAMRYGVPSLTEAFEALARDGDGKPDEVVLMPLFPQYAAATTHTAVSAAHEAARHALPGARLTTVAPFYGDSGFIESFAARVAAVREQFDFDHLLYSFHGLPERQVRREHGVCLSRPDCCAQVSAENARCYRAQCFATARALTAAMGLDPTKTSVAFQSRLGRTPWIQPYTTEALDELARKGVKRLAVMCPAFVADCLETLEEIGIRAREQFLHAGGEELRLIPSLNADPGWAETVARLVREAASPSLI